MAATTPCRFTIDHYKKILELALASCYSFVSYHEYDGSQDQNVCILRHDIDYMPEWATRFAAIESSLGIHANYFFQICAKTYNLREKETHRIVNSLVDMGHHVGLHLDIEFQDMDWADLPAYCVSEKELFKRITGVDPVEIISFHNTNRFTDQILGKEMPGMRHAYEPSFFGGMKYISDSQGWYEGCPCHMFRQGLHQRMQLLIHPYIWSQKGNGDFLGNIAQVIAYRHQELYDYFVHYHPVCRKQADELKSLINQYQVISPTADHTES